MRPAARATTPVATHGNPSPPDVRPPPVARGGAVARDDVVGAVVGGAGQAAPGTAHNARPSMQQASARLTGRNGT